MNNVDFNPLLNEVIIFRPNQRGQKLLRYAEGKWIPDDGEPDIAFVTTTQAAFAYYVDLPYQTNMLWSWRDVQLEQNVVGESIPRSIKQRWYGWHYATTNGKPWNNYSWEGRYNHPNILADRAAMDKCCSMFGCANGSPIRITEASSVQPYIDLKQIWVKSTGQLLQRPANISCYLCDNDGYGHKANILRSHFDTLVANKEYANEEHGKAEIRMLDAAREVKRLDKALTELRASPFYKPEWEAEEEAKE